MLRMMLGTWLMTKLSRWMRGGRYHQVRHY
jgi:hypothetical protein